MSKLDNAQCAEAVQQMQSHCRMLMDQYRNGTGEYVSVSARSVLRTLGFDGQDLDDVLFYCAERGFNYCIDPIIRNAGSGEFPPRSACWWGADQLESRVAYIR